MRSTLIIASMALAILAAPVPAPEDQTLSRRDVDDSEAPIETLVDKRSQRLSDGESGSLDSILFSVEKRERRYKNSDKKRDTWLEDNSKRDVRLGKDHDGPFLNDRSVETEEDEEEVEKRQIRHAASEPGSSLSKSHGRSVEDEEDEEEVEKRAVLFFDPGQTSKNGRSVEDEENGEVVEKRILRQKFSSKGKRDLRSNHKSKRLDMPVDGPSNKKRPVSRYADPARRPTSIETNGIKEARNWRPFHTPEKFNTKHGIKERRGSRPADRTDSRKPTTNSKRSLGNTGNEKSERGITETRSHRGPGDASGNPRNHKRGLKETRGRGKGEEGRKKGN